MTKSEELYDKSTEVYFKNFKVDNAHHTSVCSLLSKRSDGQGNIKEGVLPNILLAALHALDIVDHFALVEPVDQISLLSFPELVLQSVEHDTTKFLHVVLRPRITRVPSKAAR